MRTSAQTMMKASSRRFSTPTGRPVPGAHPLKSGTAPGYSPQSGYQAPGPQKSGGGKVVPLVALLAVLGGAGAYYATMDDPKAAAARDARKLESGIKNEVNDLRSGARSSSAPLIDASSSRRELERAKDNVTPSKSWSDSLGLGGNSASDEASRLGSKAQNAAEDAKDTVKSWGRSIKNETENAWNGHGEGVKDEIVRWKNALSSPDGKMGVKQVEEYLRSKGHYTTTLEPYRLFDFFGTAPSLRKTQVETSLGRYEREGEGFINSALNKASSEYERAKSSMKSAGRDAESYGREAKNETKSFFNFGGNKAEREYESAKSDVKDTYYSAKSDAKDTYYSAKSDAKDTYYNAKAEVKDTANSVSRSLDNATSEIADTADRTTRDAIGKLAAPLQRAGRRVEENVEGAADSARSTYYDAKDTIGRGVDQAGRAIDNTADDAARAARNAEQNLKAESKSWFNWSEKKAEDGKDAIKDGLLKVEKSVERGAQEAQSSTRKL